MQAIGIHGAFASAAKIASRCRLEDTGDPVVADRLDKLDRWHAALRNGLNAAANEPGSSIRNSRENASWLGGPAPDA